MKVLEVHLSFPSLCIGLVEERVELESEKRAHEAPAALEMPVRKITEVVTELRTRSCRLRVERRHRRAGRRIQSGNKEGLRSSWFVRVELFANSSGDRTSAPENLG